MANARDDARESAEPNGSVGEVRSGNPASPDAARKPSRRDLFGWENSDLLPETSADETDAGWGERGSGSDPADLRRFLDDKPPHHL